MSVYSQEQLDAIADQINNRPTHNRPRKGLGVRSPLTIYRELFLNSPTLHPRSLTPRVLHFTFESAL